MNNEISTITLSDSKNYLHIMMDTQPEYVSLSDMLEIWLMSRKCISKLYRGALIGRMNTSCIVINLNPLDYVILTTTPLDNVILELS